MDVNSVNFIYAGLLTAGGVIGYLKAASIPSLAAGAGSGAIVGLATYYNIPQKTILVAAVSGILTVAMGRRFIRSGKFIPAGLIAGSSAVTFITQLLKIQREGM
ncbi:unnamed protein product [Caenorhabditis auriculariae]|uniref:Transmembrane protein 14C n=1 Tax=Caenorhabditis auriculariae TaxID=2777116 RepID=A0A8S1GM19_9PELO|nr:unnamed protein product [Caenorhabditis auriculariae]